MSLIVFSNSFLSLAEADERIGPLSEDWLTLSASKRERFVSAASWLLNDLKFLGTAVSDTQVMSFPREAFSYFDPSLNKQVLVPKSAVPERLARATANEALHLMQNPQVIDFREKSYESISVGPISISDSTPDRTDSVPLMPNIGVRQVVAPLLSANSFGLIPWRAN